MRRQIDILGLLQGNHIMSANSNIASEVLIISQAEEKLKMPEMSGFQHQVFCVSDTGTDC